MQSLQKSKLSNIWEWGSKGLPNPNQELFTAFYAFWVLPGGSFPQHSEVQTHFCHSSVWASALRPGQTDNRQDDMDCQGRGRVSPSILSQY